jgi:hypothetical protein
MRVQFSGWLAITEEVDTPVLLVGDKLPVRPSFATCK